MAEIKHKFGLLEDDSGAVAGLSIQSVTENESVEVADVRGADGKIIEKIGYSKKASLSITGVVQSLSTGGFDLKAGNVLTYKTKKYMVMTVDKPRNVTAPNEVTITAETADAAVITPYVEPTPAA